jgi:signal transduction histidine kinase/HAMP domain-containing protein
MTQPSFEPSGAARRSRSLIQKLADLPVRTKLTIAFALILVFSISIIGYFVDLAASADLQSDMGQTLKSRVDSRSQIISSWLSQQADELSALSLTLNDDLQIINANYPSEEEARAIIAERAAEWEASRTPMALLSPLSSDEPAILEQYVTTFPPAQEAILTDRYGALVAASNVVPQYAYAEEEWWQAAWNGGQGGIYVGAPEIHTPTGKLTIPIAVPVRSSDNSTVVGIMRGRYLLDEIAEIVNGLRIGQTGRAVLIFPGAQVLTPSGQLQPMDQATRDALALVVDQDYAEINYEGQQSLTSQSEVLFPAQASPLDWKLVVVQDRAESLKPIADARLVRLVAGLLLLIPSMLIGYGLATLITKPVRRLSSVVQEFGGGDYSKRAVVQRGDEIGQLAAAFNEMADAIQTREIELQQWSSTLDRLVKDRTSELMQANTSLQDEIAERQRIQLEVLLERIRLEALIESSHDGLILISTERHIQVINQMALKMLDLPGIPHDWLEYAIGDTREQSEGAALDGLKKLQEIGLSRHNEQAVSEGETEIAGVVVRWANLPVESEDVPFGRLLVMHDVTQARVLEQMRDDLIHTMVHDLRNPLGSIMVALELFQDDPLTDDQRQMLSITGESLNRMSNMVNAILDIGRLEAGSMPLERVHAPIREIATEILNMQKPLAQQKNLSLLDEIPDNLPLLDVDPDLIARVVQNLVGNAIKFTPEGGTISIAAQPLGDDLLVTVKDTGPGIAPDVRERLFRKFATGKQKGRGSGLGLAFSRLAVEAHGGRIWVESTSGEGTTFKFTLPFAQAVTEPVNGASSEDESEQTPGT